MFHSRMRSFLSSFINLMLLSVQSSVSSAASGVMMKKKLPAAASTPAVVPSTSTKSNTAVLKHTTEPAPVTITDNEVCLSVSFLPRTVKCIVSVVSVC